MSSQRATIKPLHPRPKTRTRTDLRPHAIPPPPPCGSSPLPASRAALQLAKLGEYRVTVHVHETAALAGLDASGTSDPYVLVKCGGGARRTRAANKATGAVHDRLFSFVVPVRSYAELDTHSVELAAMDANAILADQHIGAHAIELSTVYARPQHALERQWLALARFGGEGGVQGVQGYVLASIIVLGPGDRAPQLAAAEGGEDGEDGALVSAIAVPRGVKMRRALLRVQLGRALNLPRMDRVAALTGGEGCDAYLEVLVPGQPPVRSKVISSRSPTWNELLVCPLLLPSLAQRFTLRLMDQDVGQADSIVGVLRLDIAAATDGKYAQARWHNFYGPSKREPEALRLKMRSGLVPGSKWRGKCLMSLTIGEPTPPEEREGVRATRPGERSITPMDEPRRVPTRLRLAVRTLVGLPRDISNVCAEAHLGPLTARTETARARADGAPIHLNSTASSEPGPMPSDAAQLPDVFVSLVDKAAGGLVGKLSGKPARYAHARLPIAHVLEELGVGFTWIKVELEGEQGGGAPCFMLARLEVLTGMAATRAAQAREQQDLEPLPTARWLVQLAIYQARHLPAAAGQTAPDPRAIVRVGAAVGATSRQTLSTFPQWFETLSLPVELPQELEFAPPIEMHINDERRRALLGHAVLPALLAREAGANASHQWHKLSVPLVADLQRCEEPPALLAACRLVPAPPLGTPLPPPPFLLPQRHAVEIGVMIMGLRDLSTYAGLAVRTPSVRVTLGSFADKLKVAMTSNEGPNFGELLSLSTELAEDPGFAPTLRMDVIAKRLARDVVVGTAFVPLRKVLMAQEKAAKLKGAQSEQKERDDPPQAEDSVRLQIDPPEGGSDEPTYMVGRATHECALEEVMNLAPFQDIVLRRQGRVTGTLKASVHVRSPGAAMGADEAQLRELVADDRRYTCRVYVLSAARLAVPQSSALPDAYVRATLAGKAVTGKNVVTGSSPELRTVLEFDDVRLPGDGTLEIEVVHKSPMYRDTVLGATAIDLENRLFSPQWRAFASSASADRSHAPLVPLERRTLRLLDSGTTPLGSVLCWVEILPSAEAARIEKWDISLPPPEPFELRCVVRQCRGLPSMDQLTGLNDVYVRGVLETVAVQGLKGGASVQAAGKSVGGALIALFKGGGQRVTRNESETDTHWRARGGGGSFNWRLVYNVELPVKQARMRLQAWDRDLITPNDFIGTAQLDLTKVLASALKKRRAGTQGVSSVEHFPTRKRKGKARPKKGLRSVDVVTRAQRWWRRLQNEIAPTYESGEWVKLTDSAGDPAGEVEIEISVLHSDVATVLAAGPGRSDPNAHPFLAEPLRVKWSWLRPDLILYDLLGPRLFTRLVALLVASSAIFVLFGSLPTVLAILWSG